MFSRRHAVHRVLVVGALPWVVASAKAQAVAPEMVPQVAAKSVVPSGILLLPANDLTAFLPNGKEETSVRIVPVEGQSFTQALQLTTKEQPKYTYYFQIGASTVAPVAQGDVLLATFWMRTLQAQNGYGRTNLIFETPTITTNRFSTRLPRRAPGSSFRFLLWPRKTKRRARRTSIFIWVLHRKPFKSPMCI